MSMPIGTVNFTAYAMQLLYPHIRKESGLVFSALFIFRFPTAAVSRQLLLQALGKVMSAKLFPGP